MLKGLDPLEIPSRRFTNLVLYKLQDGLDEEGQLKLNTELERTARKIQHPLAGVKVDPAPIVKRDRTKPAEPKVRERTPPPGWKSEKEAFASAMALMQFNGKGRR